MAAIRRVDRTEVRNLYSKKLQSLSGFTSVNVVVSQEQFLVYNKSLKFTNGYVDLNTSFNVVTSEMDSTKCISLSYYHSTLAAGTYGLISAYQSSTDYFQCWLNKSGSNYTIRLKIIQGGTTICDITGTAYTVDNRWNHVEILLNMVSAGAPPVIGEVKVVSNGVETAKTTNNTLATAGYWDFPTDIFLGQAVGNAAANFTGYMNNFSIDTVSYVDVATTIGYTINDNWTWPSATYPNAVNALGIYSNVDLNISPTTQASIINDKSTFKQNIPDYDFFNSICPVVGMGLDTVVYTIAPTVKPTIGFSGGGSWGAGTYYFLYTFFDSPSNRESSQSPVTKAITAAGGQNVLFDLRGLNIGYKAHFNKVRIYGGSLGNSLTLLKEITYLSAINTGSFPVVPAPTGIGQYCKTGFPCIDPMPLDFTATSIGTTLVAGGSMPTTGATYSHVVTVYNLFTGQESNPIVASPTQIPAAGNKTIRLTINGYTLPANYVYRIYRKVVTSALYEYVFDYANTGTPNVADDIYASSNPNITLDLTIKPPAPCLYVTKHGDRMYYGAQETTLSRIQYSEVGAPLRVRDASYFYAGNSNDVLTGLHGDFLNLLLAFKETEVWMYRGLDPTIFEDFRISDIYGCGAHRTIKQFSNIVAFANRRGVYVFDGARVVKISDDIDQIFSDISITNFQLASAAVDTVNELYILLIPGYKMLAFNYVDYLETKQAGWTILDHTGIDYINDGFLPTINKGYPKEPVVLYGNNTEIGFYLDYARINTGTSIQTNWFVESQKLTIKLGNKNHLKQLKAYIKSLGVGQKINFGYTINGNVQQSEFTNIGTTTEKLEKKIGVRTQFLCAKIYGLSATTNMLVTGFELSGEKRGFR